MLSPEYLRKITERTEQKVSEVNEYLTAKIIKRIVDLFNETGEVKLIPSSLLDIKKQQSAGRLFQEIQEEIEKALPEIKTEVRRAFYDAAAKISNDVNATTGEILKAEQKNGNLSDVEMPQFEEKDSVTNASELNMTDKEISCLDSAFRRTEGEIYNLTKTSASQAQKVFIEACDNAYFRTTHGTSINTAIVDAIKEVSKKGITTVHYASGHEDKIEVAIARAVRTGVNQANGDITLTRCAEAGVNFVVVSSHLGARVTPYADYRTHADWQGKVYRLDWDNPLLAKYQPKKQEEPTGKFSFLNRMREFFQNQKNKKYKDFIDTCGYGEMLGICGINCRHSFGLFYPGININNQIQFGSEENKKRYELEQKQRAMERAIRETKRELNAFNSYGLSTEEAKSRKRELKQLLTSQSNDYMEFCNSNGLSPVNYRLQVAKASGVKNEGVVNNINLINEQALISKKSEKNSFSVNMEIVNAKGYHDKFEKLPVSKSVYESAYKQSGRLLDFSDGKEPEHMIAISARNGDLIADNLSRIGNATRTGFNSEEYGKVLECVDQIILIHNHSHNVRPSGGDIVTYAKYDNIKISLVVCHDGDVFAILSADKIVANIYEEAYNHFRKEFDEDTSKALATQVLYKENGKHNLFEIRRL